MQALIGQLREHGFGVDIAHDLADARQSFFGSGGHHCLVVGPDVAPGVANAIVGSLREVDPELPALLFVDAAASGASFVSAPPPGAGGKSAGPRSGPAARGSGAPLPNKSTAGAATQQVRFHPGSRAGAVALVRFLRDLPERG